MHATVPNYLMIWTIMVLTMLSVNSKPLFIVSEMMTMEASMVNILMMGSMAMIMNYLMMNQEVSNKENAMKTMILMVGMMVMLSMISDSPMMFLLLMELTVMPLSYVIIKTSKDMDKTESLKFMVMMNTAGSFPFMMMAYYYSHFLSESSLPYSMSTEMGMTAFMILFLVKTPLFMTHLWLTKVHVSASGTCSMILASIMIKMGTLGLFKFHKNFAKEALMYQMMALSMMGSLIMVTVMVRYQDSKTLIALSSVLHMAAIIPMVALKKSSSMIASIMMMTAHGIISYFLFYLITLKYEKAQSRSFLMMKSSESTDKNLTLMLVTFMFLNMGIPPFMNFVSEVMFLFSIKAMNSMISSTIFALVLLGTVMFTMQMNSKMAYGMMEQNLMKTSTTSIKVKFMFFTCWSLFIMLAM